MSLINHRGIIQDTRYKILLVQIRGPTKGHLNMRNVLSWHRCSRIRWFRTYVHFVFTCQLQNHWKNKMETTAMWGLTLIILKDIKCFLIWAYVDITGRCNICQKSRVKPTLDFRFHWSVKNCSGIRIRTTKIILQSIWGWFKLIFSNDFAIDM
jgi:hypothetical protein